MWRRVDQSVFESAHFSFEEWKMLKNSSLEKLPNTFFSVGSLTVFLYAYAARKHHILVFIHVMHVIAFIVILRGHNRPHSHEEKHVKNIARFYQTHCLYNCGAWRHHRCTITVQAINNQAREHDMCKVINSSIRFHVQKPGGNDWN